MIFQYRKRRNGGWKKYAAWALAGLLSLSAETVVFAGSVGDLEGSITEITGTDDVTADITQDTGTDDVTADITQDTGTGDVTADITQDTSADDHVVIEADDKPYLALGADLTAEQKNTVLGLMGIDPAKLDEYQVVTVTNADEHTYLDAYLDASTIGTRALSSVVIVKREKGSGIHISTKNISYCTVGMYKNALVTAGLEDADVIVAGPFQISGTAALIGAMKAYADMEGGEVDTGSLDAAMNEIVVTGTLGDTLGDREQSEELMAYIKQEVLANGLKDEASIRDAIADACEKFDVSITDEQKEQITKLMGKIGKLDIDVDSLLEQAGSIYETLSDMDLDTDSGWLGSILAFLKGVIDSIISFFRNLF